MNLLLKTIIPITLIIITPIILKGLSDIDVERIPKLKDIKNAKR
jgi:hypothetical protein